MDNTLKYDLSVIIPCHNLEKWISKMLESLDEQNLFHFKVELIFICDNCTDNTKNVIEEFLPFRPDYAAVEILTASVSSCGLSRNLGLDIAHGEYIVFFDGDDWLLEENALAIILTSMAKFPDHNMGKFDWDYSEWYPIEERTQSQNNAMVWQYVFKKDFIGETRFQQVQPSEDVAFIRALIQNAGRLNYVEIKRKLYYYNYGRLGSNMQQYFSTGRIE